MPAVSPLLCGRAAATAIARGLLPIASGRCDDQLQRLLYRARSIGIGLRSVQGLSPLLCAVAACRIRSAGATCQSIGAALSIAAAASAIASVLTAAASIIAAATAAASSANAGAAIAASPSWLRSFRAAAVWTAGVAASIARGIAVARGIKW